MPITPQDYSTSTFQLNQKTVYVFDFDGVIISPEEDDIYEYQASDTERAELSALCQSIEVVGGDLDTRYQRHLVYQAALLKRAEISAIGPAFASFVDACNTGLAFILTARSGPHAIERVRAFLGEHKLRPTEIFHVGRVSKHFQIEYLLKHYHDYNVVYIEDSDHQIESTIANLDGHNDYGNRLHIFRVRRSDSRKSDHELQNQFQIAAKEADAVDLIKDEKEKSAKYKEDYTFLMDRWKLFSEASHNEKKWMHERLNWLLVSQPILFAALTFSFQFIIVNCDTYKDAISIDLCNAQKNQVAQIPSIIVALGLAISSLVAVALIAAGRMHWLWTTSLNKLAQALDKLERENGVVSGMPTVPFGQKPHIPARTSSVIAPIIGIIFVIVWIALAFKLGTLGLAVLTIAGSVLLVVATLYFVNYCNYKTENPRR